MRALGISLIVAGIALLCSGLIFLRKFSGEPDEEMIQDEKRNERDEDQVPDDEDGSLREMSDELLRTVRPRPPD
jgi:hypothetical protein